MLHNQRKRKEKNMKNRIFIVAPLYNGDILHIVCKTKDKDRLLDIYETDRYEKIYSTDNMKEAVTIAKKHGAKRPAII